jgi:hypothetical protein
MNKENDSLTKCILAEFATLRAELLDRLKLRTQYELLAYSIFMGLFGVSFYVGYPIIFLMLIQVFLAPMIYMNIQLMEGVFRIGSYLAARTKLDNFTKKLPWEFFSLENSYKIKLKMISAHMWLFLVPMIISYAYLLLLIVFSNLFLDILGDNATWDLIFVDLYSDGKLILICLVSVFLFINILLLRKYRNLDKTRLGLFEDYCRRLRELHIKHK